MTKKERITLIAEALPEAIEKLGTLKEKLKELDPADLEALENFIAFIDDIS